MLRQRLAGLLREERQTPDTPRDAGDPRCGLEGVEQQSSQEEATQELLARQEGVRVWTCVARRLHSLCLASFFCSLGG